MYGPGPNPWSSTICGAEWPPCISIQMDRVNSLPSSLCLISHRNQPTVLGHTYSKEAQTARIFSASVGPWSVQSEKEVGTKDADSDMVAGATNTTQYPLAASAYLNSSYSYHYMEWSATSVIPLPVRIIILRSFAYVQSEAASAARAYHKRAPDQHWVHGWGDEARINLIVYQRKWRWTCCTLRVFFSPFLDRIPLFYRPTGHVVPSGERPLIWLWTRNPWASSHPSAPVHSSTGNYVRNVLKVVQKSIKLVPNYWFQVTLYTCLPVNVTKWMGKQTTCGVRFSVNCWNF